MDTQSRRTTVFWFLTVATILFVIGFRYTGRTVPVTGLKMVIIVCATAGAVAMLYKALVLAMRPDRRAAKVPLLWGLAMVSLVTWALWGALASMLVYVACAVGAGVLTAEEQPG